jgi:hypothetical protein
MRRPAGPLHDHRREQSTALQSTALLALARHALRRPTPAEQLLRRQPVTARNGRYRVTTNMALGNDPRLLLRSPRPAPSRSGKYFHPVHRRRLRLVQKLSVRHVSNPLRFSGRTIRHRIATRNLGSKRRLQYCGNPERHEYELYLPVEDIDHSRTKTKSPQTNGICERFHKTVLNEFYRIAFRKKVYRSIDELQADLDVWIREYNETRPHQGRWCFGKTPMQTFLDAMPMTKEKMIAA